MARTVAWTESAAAGLQKAAEYIARDSPTYAAALVAGAERAADSLVAFPRRGRLVPEYRDPGVRELFVGSYRLIYQLSENSVFIIAFVHGARDLVSLLERMAEE